MSEKKNHSVTWTFQVDDAADEMNDLLREAETLEEQVCSQPPARAQRLCSLSYSHAGIGGSPNKGS